MRLQMKQLFMKLPPIIRYGLNSCFVTVVDVILYFLLYRVVGMHIVVANTIGVIAGFLIDYFLSVRYVFQDAKGSKGFSVYLGTFVIGLVLADALVYLSCEYVFDGWQTIWNTLCSKGVSIVVPFFFLYFLRKLLYQWLGKEKGLS